MQLLSKIIITFSLACVSCKSIPNQSSEVLNAKEETARVISYEVTGTISKNLGLTFTYVTATKSESRDCTYLPDRRGWRSKTPTYESKIGMNTASNSTAMTYGFHEMSQDLESEPNTFIAKLNLADPATGFPPKCNPYIKWVDVWVTGMNDGQREKIAMLFPNSFTDQPEIFEVDCSGEQCITEEGENAVMMRLVPGKYQLNIK